MANDTWSSSVIKQELNPVWEATETHDFVVFDQDQHMAIEVLDEDWMSSCDVIGRARPLRMAEAEKQSEKPMELLAACRGAGNRLGSH